MKEAAVKVTEKLDHLSVQEKSLSTEHAVVQSVIILHSAVCGALD